MAKLTINVKQSKLKQLLVYLNELDYVTVEEPLPSYYSKPAPRTDSVKKSTKDDLTVPEWHKKIVLKRLKNFNPETAIEWKDAYKSIKKKLKK